MVVQANIFGIALIQKVLQNGRIVDLPVNAAGSGTLYVETKDLDFGAPQREKYVDAIVLDLQAPEEIPLFNMKVGTRNALKEAITWTDLGYLDFNNPTVKIRQTSRFWRFKFIDEAPVAKWKLSSIEVYGRVLGLGRI